MEDKQQQREVGDACGTGDPFLTELHVSKEYLKIKLKVCFVLFCLLLNMLKTFYLLMVSECWKDFILSPLWCDSCCFFLNQKSVDNCFYVSEIKDGDMEWAKIQNCLFYLKQFP